MFEQTVETCGKCVFNSMFEHGVLYSNIKRFMFEYRVLCSNINLFMFEHKTPCSNIELKTHFRMSSPGLRSEAC